MSLVLDKDIDWFIQYLVYRFKIRIFLRSFVEDELGIMKGEEEVG